MRNSDLVHFDQNVLIEQSHILVGFRLRHTVVCHVARKSPRHTMSILLTRR